MLSFEYWSSIVGLVVVEIRHFEVTTWFHMCAQVFYTHSYFLNCYTFYLFTVFEGNTSKFISVQNILSGRKKKKTGRGPEEILGGLVSQALRGYATDY